ncbi:uncharacterized protein H6S33_007471 [Morchella sextelata]|uniref:uncharacterized protein n=1 Tax=Morchella sextelata TaxID=1174677 RepID=UPI001D056F4D|nr:uncharacterized protein H6S33_007471 [Morchella sextelata]KAH0603812.1 hypothetical protein H6S33_007471 [Morchella sextelata]
MLPLPLRPLTFTLLTFLLLLLTTHLTSTTASSKLQTSPYSSADHLLDLSTITRPHALLALALQDMDPTTTAYALTPYKAAFNWPHVMSNLSARAAAEDFHFPKTKFYIIVFRSQIEPGTNRQELGAMDMAAHREAVESGWLLKYWFGVPDELGYNLATCVWRDIKDARRGGRGKGHQAAMRAVKGLYKKWEVERLALVVGEGVKEWDIVKWEEAMKEEVGGGGEL